MCRTNAAAVVNSTPTAFGGKRLHWTVTQQTYGNSAFYRLTIARDGCLLNFEWPIGPQITRR